MSRTDRVGAQDRIQVLRSLIFEAEARTPRTAEEGLDQRGAIRFLRRKLEEAEQGLSSESPAPAGSPNKGEVDHS